MSLAREVNDAISNIGDNIYKEFSLLSFERRLSIGDSERSAFETFTKSKSAFESVKLPPKFPADLLKARSWEDDQRGFGVLTKDGRVLFAMVSHYNSTETDAAERIAQYRGAFGVRDMSTVEGNQVSYWFWQGSATRLMICVAATSKSERTITIAVGLNAIMDSLRMNITDAPKDLAAAQAILRKTPVPK